MHSYKKVFKVEGAVGYVIRVITLIFTRKYPTACAEIDKALFCEHETSPDFRKYPRIRLTFDTNSKSRICFLYRFFYSVQLSTFSQIEGTFLILFHLILFFLIGISVSLQKILHHNFTLLDSENFDSVRKF